MGKFVGLLFMGSLIISEITLGNRFHGHGSYKQFYENRLNGGQPKPVTTASYDSYDDPNNIKKDAKPRFEGNSKHVNKENFWFSDGWQARNGGGNFDAVPRCDRMNQTFCEHVPHYPEEFVNQMIARNSSLLRYAQEDVIAVSTRLDFDNEEEPLCVSTERLIRPKTALNLKNKWRYVIQTNNFLQSIRIEVCAEEDAKCRMIDGFAEGYVTMCKTKFIYRELSAISENGEIVRDYFRIPASCCCHVEFDVDQPKTRLRPSSKDIYHPWFMEHRHKHI